MSSQNSTGGSQTRQWITVGVAVAAFVGIGFALVQLGDVTQGRGAEQEKPGAAVDRPKNAVTPSVEPSLTTAEFVGRSGAVQQSALQRVELVERVETLRAEAARLQELLSLASKWRSRIDSLMRDDAGRRVASDPGSVATFETFLRRRHESPESLKRRRDATLQSVAELEGLLAAGGAPPPADSEPAEHATASGQRPDSLQTYRQDLAALDALVRSCEAKPPAGRTLADALQRWQEKEAEALVERLKAGRQAAREETLAEAERLVREAEKARLLAEARAAAASARRAEQEAVAQESEEQRKASAVEAEQRRAAEKAALVERLAQEQADQEKAQMEEEAKWRLMAQDPRVQAKFAVFLSPTRYTFSRSVGNPNVRDSEDGRPVKESFEILAGNGTMTSFDSFLKHVTFKRNQRGPWPTPPSVGPTRERMLEEYRQEFEKWSKLAPIWAEMGFFDP